MADTERLAERLLHWEERWEHGEDVPASELCEDCPDLIDQLQNQIEILKRMAWMKEAAETSDDGPKEVPDSLVSTTLAGRYRLDEYLAEGGFGRVYRGFDMELQRQVAVKIAKPGHGTAPEHADELLEEARKVAKLRHPGIVSVHDVGRTGECYFIVSDLIDGTTLAEVIATDRPAPPEAARLVAEVADALQFAHDNGFVHRDIKPTNILIDSKGKPLIADFGIATNAADLAEVGTDTSGTLAYMAPEQLAGEVQLLDHRVDVYGLGVVLYEVLTGELPYRARTPIALREQILFRPPLPVRKVNRLVPLQLGQVCLRCLAKHPADRFANAGELATALRFGIHEAARSSRRRVLWALLVVVAACATLVAGGTFLVPQFFRQIGTLAFDGKNRIVTPLERFAPVTLEAWVWPERYEYRCHFVVGSDIPSEFGIGLGTSGPLLCAEYIAGDVLKSKQAVPIHEWSHIAAVFAEHETRLYFNGKLVMTGPPTEPKGGTNFVIGNVGQSNPIDYFIGQIRSVRISEGERYTAEFTPQQEFPSDAHNDKAVLIYDGSAVEGNRVIDLTGKGNDGQWERLNP